MENSVVERSGKHVFRQTKSHHAGLGLQSLELSVQNKLDTSVYSDLILCEMCAHISAGYAGFQRTNVLPYSPAFAKLSIREVKIIATLKYHGAPRTLAELAEISRLDPATITRGANALIENHLITKKASDKDGRTFLIRLTEKGSEAADQYCHKLGQSLATADTLMPRLIGEPDIDNIFSALIQIRDRSSALSKIDLNLHQEFSALALKSLSTQRPHATVARQNPEYYFHYCSEQIARDYGTFLKRFLRVGLPAMGNLHHHEARILAILLFSTDPLTPIELGDLLRIDAATISRVMKKLLQLELVEKHENFADLRSIIYTITAKGIANMNLLVNDFEALTEQALTHLKLPPLGLRKKPITDAVFKLRERTKRLMDLPDINAIPLFG